MTDPVAKPKSLVAKLAEVMATVERIAKRGHNDFHNYDYATEADIAATVRKELAARSIMLIPAITAIAREPVGEKGSVLTTATMEMTFLDGESGETLTRPWAGAGTDKEDKGLYKAMTGGEKYFLLKTFLMPTGDDPERTDAPSKGKTTKAGVIAPDAPQTVVDASTGEQVPVGNRPPPPVGYQYIARYWAEKGWHHVLMPDASGGRRLEFKTKKLQVGEVAKQAFQDGIPVKLDVNDGWLNGVTLWKPNGSNADLDRELAAKDQAQAAGQIL